MGVDQAEQFVVHGSGFAGFAASKCFGGAMVEVIVHQIAGDAPQSFLYGSNLQDDVWAIAVFLHHFLKPADLALDAAQAFGVGFLEVAFDGHGFAGVRRIFRRRGRSMLHGVSLAHSNPIPSTPIYTPAPYVRQVGRKTAFQGPQASAQGKRLVLA